MAKTHEPDETKRKSHHMKNQLTYAYIRKIRKWMFCPACQHGKMTINKASTMWTCEECGYKLSADEFEDDYMFWFCDECNTYLNNQDGFDRHAAKHTCQNCGYENDTTLENIKGICSDCGKIISDPESTLCADCKLIRKQKAKEWLTTAGKAVGVVAAVAGVAYLASQATDDENNTDNTLPFDGNNGNEWGTTNKFNRSRKWFENATIEELQAERAKVQADYLNPDLDINYRGELWDFFPKYDNAIGEKQWEGKEPEYPVHREHGWHLPNDD